MTDEKKDEGSAGGARGKEERTGDPGRTPGTAEGDRETVEEDLQDREGKEK